MLSIVFLLGHSVSLDEIMTASKTKATSINVRNDNIVTRMCVGMVMVKSFRYLTIKNGVLILSLGLLCAREETGAVTSNVGLSGRLLV